MVILVVALFRGTRIAVADDAPETVLHNAGNRTHIRSLGSLWIRFRIEGIREPLRFGHDRFRLASNLGQLPKLPILGSESKKRKWLQHHAL